MHKPPLKLKQGWKVHTEAHNELLDYVIKTRPIAAHGFTETSNGTMPPMQPLERPRQFDPIFQSGTSPTLRIHPGYVFAAYRDSDQSSTAATLPEIQQFPFEPTVNSSSGGKLSDDPAPTISLTKNKVNYIYLELNWTAHEYLIGSSNYDGDYAFKVSDQVTTASNTGYAGGHDHTGHTGYENDHTHGSSGYTGDSHRHTITAESSHSHTIPSLTVGTGYVKIKKIFYTLNTAIFKVANPSNTQQPVVETDTKTHIPVGYIQVNKNGQMSENLNLDTSEIKWFLSGPIWANKPDNYVSGLSHDRVEPIPPRQPEDYVYPGAINTA